MAKIWEQMLFITIRWYCVDCFNSIRQMHIIPESCWQYSTSHFRIVVNESMLIWRKIYIKTFHILFDGHLSTVPSIFDNGMSFPKICRFFDLSASKYIYILIPNISVPINMIHHMFDTDGVDYFIYFRLHVAVPVSLANFRQCVTELLFMINAYCPT